MNKEILTRITFNAAMFLIGMGICGIFLTHKGCSGFSSHTTHTDTIISLGAPVVNSYTFTNPTVYKETVIIYDSTKVSLTKQDSDFIVNDYLKRREYIDSIKTDTSFFYYHAIVEKNSLSGMKVKQWYRPKVYSITTTKEYNYLLVGGGVSYFTKPSIILNVSYQKDKFDYGIGYDPIQKGGFLTIKRKFKL
jgi:hypothetical protein